MDDLLYSALDRYFGFKEFREHQLDICRQLLLGKDAFAVMATGAGKSLTFILPSLALRGSGVAATAVVISPLISLMEDQIMLLHSKGIPACALGSCSTIEEESNARKGKYPIIFATPEKITAWMPGLQELATHSRLFFAVDECHCVAEWGHDFRPEYRKLGILKEKFPSVSMVALTASATVEIQDEIMQNLKLSNPLVIRSRLNRPNLKYFVIDRSGINDLIRLFAEFRKEQISSLVSSSMGTNDTGKVIPFYSSILYVNSIREVEMIAQAMKDCPQLSFLRTGFYHGNMSTVERAAVQAAFNNEDIQLMIATIAFGMGKLPYCSIHCSV